MAQPRLVTGTPTACAACYAQHFDRQHIDYRAAIEGRLIDPSRPRGGHVDWVILCEKCLRDGLALLPEEADRTEALRAEVAELKAQLDQERGHTARLEDVIAQRPEREHAHPTVEPVTKPAPRRPRYSPKGEA